MVEIAERSEDEDGKEKGSDGNSEYQIVISFVLEFESFLRLPAPPR